MGYCTLLRDAKTNALELYINSERVFSLAGTCISNNEDECLQSLVEIAYIQGKIDKTSEIIQEYKDERNNSS